LTETLLLTYHLQTSIRSDCLVKRKSEGEERKNLP